MRPDRSEFETGGECLGHLLVRRNREVVGPEVNEPFNERGFACARQFRSLADKQAVFVIEGAASFGGVCRQHLRQKIANPGFRD